MSDNLALIQVVESQNDKETTINDQAAQLDAALTEVLTIQVDGSNAYALAADQLRRHFFIVVTEGSPHPRQRSLSRSRRSGAACSSC